MPNPEDTIRKAARAATFSYFEKRDKDEAAKQAIHQAVPAWSQDRIDGFFKRQKERLKQPASAFYSSIEKIVYEEKQKEGV